MSGSDSVSNTPYGTLYNFFVASGGTISGDSNDTNSTYDICPAGWRLPTGDSSGDFQALYNNYNSVALMRAPVADGGVAVAFAGYVNSGAPQAQESYARYWTSTASGIHDRYILNIDQWSASPTSYNSRNYGRSIRCLVK